MSELKPCPFCGGEAELCYSEVDIFCRKCNVMQETELWNTRPIEDDLRDRIVELSQAVGLITTLKPTMVMDADHPLDMAKEVEAYVTARIAELEEVQE